MKYGMTAFLLASLLLVGQKSFAWGSRGHHTICAAAVFLVQDKNFKEFLRERPDTMGHLCNIPDIYWRSIPPEMTKEGNATHFFDSELVALPVKDFPLDYKQLITEYEGKKKADGEGIIRSFPHEFGSLWWRADQFYRRAVAEKDGLAKVPAPPPPGQRPEMDDNSPYSKAVYNFYVNLGLMGHFVGDDSQPLHITDDYDGYKKGHGGIHGYYEDYALSDIDGDLLSKVIKEAKKMREASRKETFLKPGTVLERMKALAVLSYADIDAVLKADQLIKPSEQKEEHGMKLRTAAERPPIEKTIKKFEPLIIKHLARAAALLATLWDDAYKDAGLPNLKSYRSYKYPLEPDFVYPDYYEIKKEEPKK
jgi:hypothetical protein